VLANANGCVILRNPRGQEVVQVSVFRLTILFSGVDFDDDGTFERLAELRDIVWRAQGRFAFATTTVEAPTALKAADIVTRKVTERVSTARPVRLDEDLVGISDIASRVGVSREAVRNWANGTRQANFPLPRGVIGDSHRVWAWADVNKWLLQNLAFGDSGEFPSAHDAALINALFADIRDRQTVTAAASATWNVAQTLETSEETRRVSAPVEQSPWIKVGQRRERLSVVRDEDYAAA